LLRQQPVFQQKGVKAAALVEFCYRNGFVRDMLAVAAGQENHCRKGIPCFRQNRVTPRNVPAICFLYSAISIAPLSKHTVCKHRQAHRNGDAAQKT